MTDLPTCPRCGRPIHDQAYICGPCAGRLTKDLAAAASVAGEAWTTIARQAVMGSSGRSSERPLPFSWEAADAVNSVANTFTTWARHCSEERGIPWGPPPAVLGPLCGIQGCPSCLTIRRSRRRPHALAWTARWLAGQIEWLRHRREADEAFEELHDACRLAIRTVDLPPDRTFAGRCECGTYLYAFAGRETVRCVECEREYDVEAMREHMRTQLDESLFTAAEVATLAAFMGISANRQKTRKLINVWHARGVVAAHGSIDGDPVFRFGEVIERVAGVSASRRSSDDLVPATVTA